MFILFSSLKIVVQYGKMTIYDIAKYLIQLNELLYRIRNNECTHTGIGVSGTLLKLSTACRIYSWMYCRLVHFVAFLQTIWNGDGYLKEHTYYINLIIGVKRSAFFLFVLIFRPTEQYVFDTGLNSLYTRYLYTQLSYPNVSSRKTKLEFRDL